MTFGFIVSPCTIEHSSEGRLYTRRDRIELLRSFHQRTNLGVAPERLENPAIGFQRFGTIRIDLEGAFRLFLGAFPVVIVVIKQLAHSDMSIRVSRIDTDRSRGSISYLRLKISEPFSAPDAPVEP